MSGAAGAAPDASARSGALRGTPTPSSPGTGRHTPRRGPVLHLPRGDDRPRDSRADVARTPSSAARRPRRVHLAREPPHPRRARGPRSHRDPRRARHRGDGRPSPRARLRARARRRLRRRARPHTRRHRGAPHARFRVRLGRRRPRQIIRRGIRRHSSREVAERERRAQRRGASSDASRTRNDAKRRRARHSIANAYAIHNSSRRSTPFATARPRDARTRRCRYTKWQKQQPEPTPTRASPPRNRAQRRRWRSRRRRCETPRIRRCETPARVPPGGGRRVAPSAAGGSPAASPTRSSPAGGPRARRCAAREARRAGPGGDLAAITRWCATCDEDGTGAESAGARAGRSFGTGIVADEGIVAGTGRPRRRRRRRARYPRRPRGFDEGRPWTPTVASRTPTVASRRRNIASRRRSVARGKPRRRRLRRPLREGSRGVGPGDVRRGETRDGGTRRATRSATPPRRRRSGTASEC